jgi:hypothetical protein
MYQDLYSAVWGPKCLQYALYRVSIKFFPDYKDLLQENCVEYRHAEVLKCTNVL